MVRLLIICVLIFFIGTCFANVDSPFKKFSIFWEAPSKRCSKQGVNLNSQLKSYGLTLNPDENYNGDYITIFYSKNFGKWPCTEDGEEHYGGLPQNGNLTDHLDQVETDIKKVLDPNYSGLAIIDMELYKPSLMSNYGGQKVYRTYAIKDIEAEPSATGWDDSKIQEEAIKSFNYWAKQYLLETLKLAKKLCPKARWGYYHYPYCAGIQHTGSCNQKVNDEIDWLFNESTALFPSVYFSGTKSTAENSKYIEETIKESKRLSQRSGGNIPTYIYTAYKNTKTKKFYTLGNFTNSLDIISKSGVDGAILWGGSSDYKTADDCKDIQNLFAGVKGLGNVVRNYT